jgi:DNA-binding transcriptional MerR regulator
MEYTLEDMVRLSGFSVDTIRYYQSLRLIQAPRHRGRKAVYTEEHLDRLRIINRAAERGLPLKIMREVFSKEETLASDDALLTAVEKQLARPCHTRTEMAKLLGVPEKLLRLVENRGLADPLEQGDASLRYSDDDLRIARDALKLIEHGFPLTSLLTVAMQHDRAMRKTAAAAISLFHKHVCGRKRGDGTRDAEHAAEVFRELFPIITSLVGHHFQRVLAGEALKQLKRTGEDETLQVARRSIGQAWAALRMSGARMALAALPGGPGSGRARPFDVQSERST